MTFSELISKSCFLLENENQSDKIIQIILNKINNKLIYLIKTNIEKVYLINFNLKMK